MNDGFDHSQRPAQPNQSVHSGLDCLLYLASEARPVGSAEAARALGMAPTRVSRLLGTLAYLGLARRTRERKYVPGPGIHALAAMTLRGSGLLNAALPLIEDLIRSTRLTVALGVLWRRHVCYLYHGGPDRPVEAAIVGHDLYPAERSIIGKILLAYRRPEDVRTEYGAGQADVDVDVLLRELAETRLRGYALGDASLAVPLGDPPVAGLALSARKALSAKRIPGLIRRLSAAAAQISAGASV
ncbi:MAG: helix-turn-helix domain-containing protein [Kiritimatiellae bacterium]|nr:helix-turn-helix domain-containing protein [Kiritimatiellia bacterium]